MAFYFDEPARTFNEYLLVPGYSSSECIPEKVSLKTPLVKHKKGEEPAISLNIPMVSAIMQAVSDDKMAIALATQGGLSFIYGSQTVEDEAAMVARVKSHKAGFVVSDANLSPETTLGEVLELREATGHSTMPVTEDGTAAGKLLGIVTERDYRLSRMGLEEKVATFMTPRARNWQRYDLGGTKKKMAFEEGVDSYVPYAGSLKDNVDTTLSKVKSTMCNCGALSIPELQDKAKLTVVSSTSITEGGAHDVMLKDKSPYVGNTIG